MLEEQGGQASPPRDGKGGSKGKQRACAKETKSTPAAAKPAAAKPAAHASACPAGRSRGGGRRLARRGRSLAPGLALPPALPPALRVTARSVALGVHCRC